MERVGTRVQDEPILLREAARPGALSGLAAAALMGIFWMVASYVLYGDLWRPLNLIAATLLGEEAEIVSGFQPVPVLLGTAIHLAMGVALGIFFAWLGGYLITGAAVGWGIIFGLAVWVIMQFGLLPVVNPPLAAFPPLPLALIHGIFGATLGTYPRFLPPAVEVQQVWRKAA